MKKKEKEIKYTACPECYGAGGFLAGHNSSDSVDCSHCSGTGKVPTGYIYETFKDTIGEINTLLEIQKKGLEAYIKGLKKEKIKKIENGFRVHSKRLEKHIAGNNGGGFYFKPADAQIDFLYKKISGHYLIYAKNSSLWEKEIAILDNAPKKEIRKRCLEFAVKEFDANYAWRMKKLQGANKMKSLIELIGEENSEHLVKDCITVLTALNKRHIKSFYTIGWSEDPEDAGHIVKHRKIRGQINSEIKRDMGSLHNSEEFVMDFLIRYKLVRGWGAAHDVEEYYVTEGVGYLPSKKARKLLNL